MERRELLELLAEERLYQGFGSEDEGGLDVESGTEVLQEGRRALGSGVEVHGVNLGRGV